MTECTVDELARVDWMPSRIPALDALVRFVPNDGPHPETDPVITTSRGSKWYPTEGGFRVVVPIDSKTDHDLTKWHVEKGIWDQEDCDLCGENIPAMTLCWVTKYDPYILLCEACHAKVAAAVGDA